jgi:1,4-dihydroxy-2-naphthoyl-CoA hydrolase
MDVGVDATATALYRRTIPFVIQLGVEFPRDTKEEVRARVVWTESGCATGAVCAFHDRAGGTATIESRTNFPRPVRSGHATAISRPMRARRRNVVVETDIVDDAARLAARVTQSQAVL